MPAPPRRVEPPRRAEPPPAVTEPPAAQQQQLPPPPQAAAAAPNNAAQPQPQQAPSGPQAQPAAAVRPRAAEQRGRGRFAANDDRRPAGAAPGFPRRPSRMIYPVAMGVSVLWAVLVISMGISGDVFSGGFSLATPGALNFVLLLFLPVGFFWAIATMVWRAQEMRIVSRQIGDLASRLSEPETIATDAVVNV
ncbi:MAG: hypothetical protein J0H08_06360, partial [Rhizobiales bacterium]|nr:hypothetical protein [Hyphomicrobiales bacterium]